MQGVAFRLQFADDQLHTSRYTIELTQLFIRITPKSQRAVIGHTDLMAVCQFDTFLAQKTTQRPDAVTRRTATRDDREDLGLRTDLQSRNHIGQSRWQVEVIGRKDQTDTFLGCPILLHGFGQSISRSFSRSANSRATARLFPVAEK